MEKKGTIKFGFSNDKNPMASWEGMGFRDDNHIWEADYFGAIESNDGNIYMITQITDASNQELKGQFFVVDATTHGSFVFLDQEQSDVAKTLQEGLNSGKYSNIQDILNDSKMGLEEANEQFQNSVERSFEFSTYCSTTAIKHEEFNKMIGREEEAVEKRSIRFGFTNGENPMASWEGTGFRDDNHIWEADYLGSIESPEGSIFIVTQITDASNKKEVGQFLVVDATAKENSFVFLDQEQSDVANTLQERLNSGKYSNIQDILADREIGLVEANEQFQNTVERSFEFSTYCLTTAIEHKEFLKKIGREFEETVEQPTEQEEVEHEVTSYTEQSEELTAEYVGQPIQEDTLEQVEEQKEEIAPEQEPEQVEEQEEIIPAQEPEHEESPEKETSQTQESQQLQQSVNPEKELWMERFSNWYDSIDRFSQTVRDKLVAMKAAIMNVIKDLMTERDQNRENDKKGR